MWLDLEKGVLEEFAERARAPDATGEEQWHIASLTLVHGDNLRGMTERRVLTDWRSRHETDAWRSYNTQWQRDHADERNRRKRERRAEARVSQSSNAGLPSGTLG